MMILRCLLVVLVVLLGSFQVVSSENESLPRLNEAFLDLSSIEPNHIKASSENKHPNEKERTQGKSADVQPVTHSLKVTELHDPFNIIERINKGDTTYSHSITSDDFAQRTSLVNMISKDKKPSEHIFPKLDGTESENILHSLVLPVQDEYKVLHDMSDVTDSYSANEDLVEDSDYNLYVGTLNITELTSNPEDNVNDASDNYSEQSVITMSYTDDDIIESCNVTGELQQSQNLTDLLSKAKDEIKTYSNDAVIAWEDLKERVSSDNEVSHVLNDYYEKIKISQAVNKSECVEVYVEKYESRMKFLTDVMRSCELQLKREQWYELQNRTKEVLKSINEIVQELNLAKENVQSGLGVNYELDQSIIIQGMQKLKSLDIESEKQALSDLKKSALNSDEDDYRDCIMRNTGHEIIVDTLNDIMKIKNNCVG